MSLKKFVSPTTLLAIGVALLVGTLLVRPAVYRKVTYIDLGTGDVRRECRVFTLLVHSEETQTALSKLARSEQAVARPNVRHWVPVALHARPFREFVNYRFGMVAQNATMAAEWLTDANIPDTARRQAAESILTGLRDNNIGIINDALRQAGVLTMVDCGEEPPPGVTPPLDVSKT